MKLSPKLLRLSALLILTSAPFFSSAQKEAGLYAKAEEQFQTGSLEDAMRYYKEVAGLDPQYQDVPYKLEICSLMTSSGDDKSLNTFLSFENSYGVQDDHYFYWLGQIYTRRYMISEAIRAFEQFQQQVSYTGSANEESTQALIAHSRDLKAYFDNPDNYEIHQLETPVNSAYAELSPVYFEQGGELLFASNRAGSGETPFRVYYTKKTGLNSWLPLKEVTTLGTFSRKNANIEIVNEDGKLFTFREDNGGDLYYSQASGDNWTLPVEFDSRVSNNHIASHFFINEHEDRIIFSSEEQNSLDIHESFKDPETGKWSKPSPFHSNINSVHIEDSPYLSPDENTLYFCSDRPGGVGGMDVYISTFNGADYSWSKPVNMGWPINSPDNEFHFKMNSDQKSGYFVSDRLHTKGDFDIYFFWEVEKVKVTGRIFDQQANGPLTDAEIRFHPSQYLDEYFRSEIDQTGRYSTSIIADEIFNVEILKGGTVIYDGKFEVHDAGGELVTHVKDFTVN